MKKLLLLYCVTIIIGCSAHPRYRTGGQETPPQTEAIFKAYMSTNDNIKMSLILQSYLGRPYRGSSKYDPGLDCSEFTKSVYKRYNNTILPRTAEDQFKEGTSVHFNHLRYGDLVFFHTNGKNISHVGIYVGDMRFIHTSSSRGVIITNINEKYWSERYVGARRIL